MTNRQMFYLFNFLVLAFTVWAGLVDNDREWKVYQKEFKRLEVERITDALAKAAPDAKEGLEGQLKAAKRQGYALKQAMAPALNRYDRCVTCHQGFDPLTNPTLVNSYKDHPYKAPEVAAHRQHNLVKFACTSCHMGQGLATTVADAHGEVPHWEEPMLQGAYIQASCVRCHANF